MSGIGIIIAVFFLVRFISNKNAVQDHTNPPTASKDVWIWLSLFVVLSFAYFVITAGSQTSALGQVFLALLFFSASLCLFPSLFAQLSIYFGWVKVSYWLGRIAYNRHQKDLFGGALFYGWRAALRNKGENKIRNLKWLEERLAKYTGTLGSGAMVVQGMLKGTPTSYALMRNHFNLLLGLNKNWLPANIAAYAFRYMLARACQEHDFAEIRNQARGWQLMGKNRFAQWVDMFHWSTGADIIPWRLRLTINWLYLWVGKAKLRCFIQKLSQDASRSPASVHSLAQLKQAEFVLLHSGDKTGQWLNDAWRTYCAGQMAEEWSARIKNLGSFNEQEVLARIQQSVHDLISLRSGEGDLDSEAAMLERDNEFKLLQIKIAAMTNRSEQSSMMSGVQEYEEFLAIIRVAERIAKDDNSRAQVFFQLRSPVWNWMVELWNTTQNRPLAFLAGSYMAPLASEFGDTQAHEFFTGIIGNQFT